MSKTLLWLLSAGVVQIIGFTYLDDDLTDYDRVIIVLWAVLGLCLITISAYLLISMLL